MTIFTFQDEAEKKLSIIRSETNPLGTNDEDGEDDDEKDEDESEEEEDDGDESEEKEEEEEEEAINIIKPKQRNTRRSSPTLIKLIREHCGIDLGRRVDKAYLMEALSENQKEYAKLDKDELERRLIQLQRIISVTHANAGTGIKFFTEVTSIFYKYHISTKKNSSLLDMYPAMVKNKVHSDGDVSTAHVIEKQRRRVVKLSHQFTETWSDVQQKMRAAYDKAMELGTEGINALNVRKRNIVIVGLLAALACSFGTRKMDLLDPNIKFYTYKRWNTLCKKNGLSVQPFRIGSMRLDDDEHDSFININEERWSAQEGIDGPNMDYIGLQVGNTKDKHQRANRYMDKKDPRWITDLVIMKPNTILKMEEFVEGRNLVLKVLGISTANFKPTKHKSARAIWSGRVGSSMISPVMKNLFPDSYALSLEYGYRSGFGLHFLRKVYVAAAINIYTQQIQDVTGRRYQGNVLASMLLAHGGGLETSLSYQNVHLITTPKAGAYAMPSEHSIQILTSRMDSMQAEITELKQQLARSRLEAGQNNGEDETEVMFTLAELMGNMYLSNDKGQIGLR